MKIKLFQIDAFTSKVFSGNPAAVCPLDSWISDDLMQKIALENNLSETAFFVKEKNGYALRWFTPLVEVNLCGHATLASAYVITRELGDITKEIIFFTKSGQLNVRSDGNKFLMDFPTKVAERCEPPKNLVPGLGKAPEEVYCAEDYLVVYKSEKDIERLSPKLELLRGLPLRGVIATAPGDQVDFVSRWFGPNVGVDEDPVTGSAHCTLTPYWAKRLNKLSLTARQISLRGGDLQCELRDQRVIISGQAIKYLEGEIEVF